MKISGFVFLVLFGVSHAFSQTPNVFIVNNNGDNSDISGTLRWAIAQANGHAGRDTIKFSLFKDTIFIVGGTSLSLTDNAGLFIDGDVDGDGTPDVAIIDNSAASYGLSISSSNNDIKSLNIHGFESANILINSVRKNKIRGCYIGIGLDGISNSTYSGNYQGIQIASTGVGNIMIGDTSSVTGRNIISGHSYFGITISNSADSVYVAGNYIGVDITGSGALGNGSMGIYVGNTGKEVHIGTGNTNGGNVISGNNYGIGIEAGSRGGITISNNIIGLNASGTAKIPNNVGIRLFNNPSLGSPKYMHIGMPGWGNVISGNAYYGLLLENADSNTVVGNFIGTNKSGQKGLGNGSYGIYSNSGSDANIIGGKQPGERNVISGNRFIGIYLLGSSYNKVIGNYIGLTPSGTDSVMNGNGVFLGGYAKYNVIGDSADVNGRNFISGNGVAGITNQANSDSNWIVGNVIGLDASSTIALPNLAYGIQLLSRYNRVGSVYTPSGIRNIISGNASYGIRLDSSDNTVINNIIGLGEDGSTMYPNIGGGIHIYTSNNNTVGIYGGANIISGNGGPGVFIEQSYNNTISHNTIGADINGTIAKANAVAGIKIFGGGNNQIGQPFGLGSNLISGNNGATTHGIMIQASLYNKILGNLIGTDASGSVALPNGSSGAGIFLDVVSKFNQIGDTTSTNVIASGYYGIKFQQFSDSNYVMGNFIGIKSSGLAALGNNYGIWSERSKDNIIGGSSPKEGNVVSGNTNAGIAVYYGKIDARNNIIGLDKLGTSAVPNGVGVDLQTSTYYSRIGYPTQGNIISGNTTNGINITSDSCIVQGNYIGTDKTGLIDLGNQNNGIDINGSAVGNLIGGYNINEGNLISGNDNHGIRMISSSALGGSHKIVGNRIGVNSSISSALGNTNHGIFIDGSASPITNNIIGDSVNTGVASGINVISGNGQSGIVISGLRANRNMIIGNKIGANIIGTVAIPNLQHGISILNGAKNNQIGITTGGIRNYILGNTQKGIFIQGSDSNRVVSNHIGIANNNTIVPNESGVTIDSSKGVFVGYNIISGNTSDGIQVSRKATAKVVANVIGWDGTWTVPSPNGGSGIAISQGARVDSINNNEIAYNGQYGIVLDGNTTDSSIFNNNTILKNSAGGIGILNGAQKGIAPPRIKHVNVLNGVVSGSAAPNAYIQIYQDDAGLGQGRYKIGSTYANAAGDWTFTVTNTSNREITAVQDSALNTSAFSSGVLPSLSLLGSISAFPSSGLNFGTIFTGDSSVITVKISAKTDHIKLTGSDLAISAPFRLLSNTIENADTLILGVDTVSATFSFVPTVQGDFLDTIVIYSLHDTLKIPLVGKVKTLFGNISAVPTNTIDFDTIRVSNTSAITIKIAAQTDNIKITGSDLSVGAPFHIQSNTIENADTLILGIDTLSATYSFEPSVPGTYLDTIVIYSLYDTLKIPMVGTALENGVPVLAIHILRSTIANKYIDVVVNANENLSEISGQFTLDSEPKTTAALTPVHGSSKTFSSDYRLRSGSLKIDFTAKDLAGNIGTISRTYAVGEINKNATTLKYENVTLSLLPDVHRNEEGFLMVFSEPANATLSKPNLVGDDHALIQISDILHVLTTSSTPQFTAKLIWPANTMGYDEQKIGLYKFSENQQSWVSIGGMTRKSVSESVIKEDGVYALFYDPTYNPIPSSLDLKQNFPNPFNPTTTIRFDLPVEGNVVLSIHNLLGQQVAVLKNSFIQAGSHSVMWDGRNSEGRIVSSGVYLYRLKIGDKIFTKRMMLLK